MCNCGIPKENENKLPNSDDESKYWHQGKYGFEQLQAIHHAPNMPPFIPAGPNCHSDCYCRSQVQYPLNHVPPKIIKDHQKQKGDHGKRKALLEQLNICTQEICDCELIRKKLAQHEKTHQWRRDNCSKSCANYPKDTESQKQENGQENEKEIPPDSEKKPEADAEKELHNAKTEPETKVEAESASQPNKKE